MKTIDFRKKIFMKPTVFCVMVYPTCHILDIILNRYLDKGIKNVKHDKYCLYIEFTDGVKAELWNENKYYAWLSSGRIRDFYWKNSRPRKSTMRKLRYKLEEYYKTKIK